MFFFLNNLSLILYFHPSLYIELGQQLLHNLIWSRGFQCSISVLDPGPNYMDCISGVGTRDPIKIYRENQNVVLNTIFTANPQYIYFVLKKKTL